MNRGRNNFDIIRYEYYRDDDRAFEAFKAGEIDIRQENTARNWAIAYDIPPVKDGRIQRAEITHESRPPMQCFVFNLRREMFKDRRVREAIGHAVRLRMEQQEPVLRLLHPHNSSFFGNSELAATGLPSPEELKILEPLRGKIPDEVFTQEFNPPEDRRHAATSASRRASAHRAAQGGRLGDQGRQDDRARTGKKLAFEMLLSDAALRAHRAALQAEPRAHRHRHERAHRRHRAVPDAARTTSTST